MATSPSSTPTPDPEDAWLERLLRQPAAGDPAAAPGDSAAFAQRVLAALPKPAVDVRRSARRRRTLLLAGAAVLGGVVACLCGGPAMIEALREITFLARAADAHLQGAEIEIVHVLAGVSGLAMLWFLSRRDLRRLFQ